MKHIGENNWFIVPTAMFFGFCGVLAAVVPYSHEILFFNDLRKEPLNSIFHFLTHCGEFWAYLVFGLLALVMRKYRFAALIGMAGILSLPLIFYLKDVIAVDRPITYFEKKEAQAQLVLVPGVSLNRGQTSFPSGHTMAAFCLYSLLALMAGYKHKQWGAFFALMGILVGVSRVFLVQHFLADILGGATLGLLFSALLWHFSQRFIQKDKF